MASRAPCDPTALAERFLDARRSGSRLSIDGLLDSSDIRADREATRAEVVRILGRRLRESTGQRPMLPQGDPALPTGSSGAGPGLTPAHVPPPELPGYEIIDLIGRGGMGVVWEAYQTATGRRVAVKFLNDSSASTEMARQRFEREVELLARLQHPNIVSIVDSGVHSGRYFYAMDYVEGRPLDEALAPGSCDVRQALELMATIAEAVDFAHQRGVLHRDLKPGNILVVDDESSARAVRAATMRERSTLDERQPLPYGRGSDRALNPQPKVLDFGLAKAMDPGHAGSSGFQASLSEPGQLLGTLAYMPPEQSRGRLAEMSVRSDVYALGAVAYELLTGRLPVAIDGALGDVLARIANQDPPIPSSVRPSLSADIDAILLKALQKSPERRYATAAEFTADIRRFLSDQPVLARPDTFAYRARKFVRRNKLVVSFAASVFALLVGFGVWMSVLYARAEERRKETEQVADFQARMLSEIDVPGMGVRMRQDLMAEASAMMRQTKLDIAEMKIRHANLESHLAGLNLTNVALKQLDRDIFERALKAAGEQFGNQPSVQVRLFQALAVTLRELGLLDRATHAQRQALEVSRESLGDEHPQTLRSIDNMGVLLHSQGRLSDAERYLCEALEKNRRVLGAEHPYTLDTMSSMAYLLKDQGRLAEAEVYCRESLEKSRRTLGEEHADTLTAMNTLASLLDDQGKLTEAEGYYREALEKRRLLHGDEHPHTLASINNLGGLLENQGKLVEAESYYRDALAKLRRVLGDEHPYTISSINNMGALLQAQGKLADAEVYYREALEKFRRGLGDEHPRTLTSINNLGTLLQAQGKFAEAEIYSREAMVRTRRALGDEHPLTLLAIKNMADLLEDQGKLLEAERYYHEAIGKQRRVLGDEHPNTLTSISNLGYVLQAQGRHAEAEGYYREVLSGRRKKLGPGRWETANAELGLGKVLRELSRYDEAQTHLLVAEPILRTAAGVPPGRHARCLAALAELYEKWHADVPGKGYDVKAAEWRAKLAAWEATTRPATTQSASIQPANEASTQPVTRSR